MLNCITPVRGKQGAMGGLCKNNLCKLKLFKFLSIYFSFKIKYYMLFYIQQNMFMTLCFLKNKLEFLALVPLDLCGVWQIAP